MTKSQLESYRKELLILRAELIAEGDIKIDPTRTDPNDVGDEDTQPLTEMSQVIASKRNRDRAVKLKKIHAAIKRIDDEPDMFGLCDGCEEPIGKRLKAMPYADLCVPCQSAKDEPRGGARKHLTDFR